MVAGFHTGCDSVAELVDPAELEAQLRADPTRPAKAAQLFALIVVHDAGRVASDIARAPAPACRLRRGVSGRWTAELSLSRERGTTRVSSWTETRTLDWSASGVALDYHATFRTEIGGEGTQAAHWRVIGDDAWIGVPATEGPLWTRRDTEERERQRVESQAWGVLQALLDATPGWERTPEGWVLGANPLRCSTIPPDPFVARFVTAAEASEAALTATREGRELRVRWTLTDGSTLVAVYTDRIGELPSEITAPPADRIVVTAPDRSLSNATALLQKLAQAGLAEVASQTHVPN